MVEVESVGVRNEEKRESEERERERRMAEANSLNIKIFMIWCP